MKILKIVILVLLIGVGAGMWMGVNIGKDKPVFSNPFTEKSVVDKLKDSGKDALDKGGDLLKKGLDKVAE